MHSSFSSESNMSQGMRVLNTQLTLPTSNLTGLKHLGHLI